MLNKKYYHWGIYYMRCPFCDHLIGAEGKEAVVKKDEIILGDCKMYPRTIWSTEGYFVKDNTTKSEV